VKICIKNLVHEKGVIIKNKLDFPSFFYIFFPFSHGRIKVWKFKKKTYFISFFLPTINQKHIFLFYFFKKKNQMHSPRQNWVLTLIYNHVKRSLLLSTSNNKITSHYLPMSISESSAMSFIIQLLYIY